MRFEKNDYVRIRSWKEMVEEFGIVGDGDIDTPQVSFVEDMKKYCGEIRKVSVADGRDDTYQVGGISTYWFPEESLLPAKKQRALRKGDKVLVRSWESMEEEFGIDDDGDIDSTPCFATRMKEYCGKTMIVSDVRVGFVYLKGADGWCFTPEHVTLTGPVIKEGDIVQLMSWDDLEETYGVNEYGEIETPSLSITESRAEQCGKTLKVARVDEGDNTFFGDDMYWYPQECIARVVEPGEDTEEVTEATGLASDQEHYKASAMQPIEVMQTFLSHEAFKGFLIGNYIKYSMRAQHKGQAESDNDKAKQYLYWYTLVKNNDDYFISPETDVPDSDWTGEGALA